MWSQRGSRPSSSCNSSVCAGCRAPVAGITSGLAGQLWAAVPCDGSSVSAQQRRLATLRVLWQREPRRRSHSKPPRHPLPGRCPVNCKAKAKLPRVYLEAGFFQKDVFPPTYPCRTLQAQDVTFLFLLSSADGGTLIKPVVQSAPRRQSCRHGHCALLHGSGHASG